MVNELLQGARTVKLYAWEDAMASRVATTREGELTELRVMAMCRVLQQFLSFGLPTLATVPVFVLYERVHGALNKNDHRCSPLNDHRARWLPSRDVRSHHDVITIDRRSPRVDRLRRRRSIRVHDDGARRHTQRRQRVAARTRLAAANPGDSLLLL